MSILNLFPGTPRPQQAQALLKFEQLYQSKDVFVINAPVAVGKSNIAYTIAKFVERAAILTPNNILVEQYIESFPDLVTLQRKESYYCVRDKRSCTTTEKKCEKRCDDCPLTKATRDFYEAPVYIANYYTYLAHKQWRETLIVDEAHNLLKMLTDDAAKRIWRTKDYYPPTVQFYDDVLAWLETRGPKYSKLLSQLKRDRNRSLLYKTWEYLRGELKECLKFVPIDAREQPPILWNPHKVKKIILLSATINYEDIYDLGLDRRRLCFINVDSPIAPHRRPVIYSPAGKVNYKSEDRLAPVIAARVQKIADANPNTKGLIHATYGLAQKLKPLLTDSRYLWHTSSSRTATVKQFLEIQEPKVLIASGLTEGLDLSYDRARWQVIAKIQYPSLANPAVDHKRQARPSWYAWQAVLAILQASGRVCRTPLDFGKTYIIDENFEHLYVRYQHLFPSWFKEALKEEYEDV